MENIDMAKAAKLFMIYSNFAAIAVKADVMALTFIKAECQSWHDYD